MSSPKQSVRIEPAGRTDVAVLLTLIRELAAYERLSDQVVATEADLSRALFSSPPQAEAVLAWHDSEAVGFALYFHTFSTFVGKPGLHLEDLFVRPMYRRHGIGRQLLVYLAQLAKTQGCGRFEWSVLNWNKPAIGLYQKVGASPMDEWTIYRLSGTTLSALASEFRK
tara:strand:+ start:999 stop:1502 length:504 start_codon:yes stop_codon:yes gene_type:complete